MSESAPLNQRQFPKRDSAICEQQPILLAGREITVLKRARAAHYSIFYTAILGPTVKRVKQKFACSVYIRA